MHSFQSFWSVVSLKSSRVTMCLNNCPSLILKLGTAVRCFCTASIFFLYHLRVTVDARRVGFLSGQEVGDHVVCPFSILDVEIILS